MELFTLLAKLSLDTKEYDKAIESAKSKASGFELEDPSLGLDKSDFDTKVAEAQGTEVDDPEKPELGLEKKDFDATVKEAEDADIDDPEKPELGLEKEAFDTTVKEAEGTDVSDPEKPSLGLDANEFNTEISNVEHQSEDFSGNVMSIFSNIKGALVTTGIVTVLSKVGSLLKESINLAAQNGDAIDKGAKRLGVSNRNYQVWDHALKQSGGSVNDLSRGLMNFRAILGDANSVTNDEADALNKLGISLRDSETGGQKSREQLAREAQERMTVASTVEEQEAALAVYNSLLSDGTNLTEDQANAFRKLGVGIVGANGQLKTAEQLMDDTLLALAAYDDKNKDRDSIVDTLFGRNAGSVKALIADGVQPMVDLMNEADDLGLIMTDEEVANAVQYGDALANLHTELDAIKTAFVADLMPLLTGAIKDVTKILAFFNPRINENSLSGMFSDTDEQLSSDLVTIEATAKEAETLIDKLFSMGDATKLTAKEQAEWKTNAKWLLENIPSLSGVIDIDTLSIHGNTEEIKANIQQWKLQSIERAKQQALEAKQQALAQKTTEWIDKRTKARELEIKAETEQIKQNDLLKQAYEKMPESEKQRFQSTFTNWTQFNDDGSINWDDSGIYADLRKIFSSNYKEWGFSGYAGSDLQNSLAQMNEFSGMTKTQEEAQKAKQEADSLAEEVKSGQEELENYTQAMSEVFGAESKSLGLTQGELDETKERAEAYKETISTIPTDVYTTAHFDTVEGGASPEKKAIGSRYIPYNNFPALLHRGEEVLTATQARKKESEGTDIGAFESAMERAIMRGMSNAHVDTYVSDGEVARGANRINGREIESGRYLP